MIHGKRMIEGSACTKILFHGYEISIAMDDSCGMAIDLIRSSIRVYHNNLDVTDRFVVSNHQHNSNYIDGTGDNLYFIMNQILNNPPFI